jgi:hypothetical protein
MDDEDKSMKFVIDFGAIEEERRAFDDEMNRVFSEHGVDFCADDATPAPTR